MARFRSKEARLKELEDRKLWLNNPGIDTSRLSRADSQEHLVYKVTGEVGKALSEDMSVEELKEIINLYESGEIEQAQEQFKRYVVDRQDKR
ncbi:MAG: hypothetical protein KME67_10845 [Candidatus Thiodiazotropha sp. (ex Codakia orbicularis)]|nr:hypothetical protein [Candidatus Thiodiazotropha sp. (ex Codakia orbicularis)]